MTTFGKRLAQIRGEKSQDSFSKRFDFTQKTLSNYENGKGFPTADKVAEICTAYGVSPAWLLLGIGPMSLTDIPTESQGNQSRDSPNHSDIAQLKMQLAHTCELKHSHERTINALEAALAVYQEKNQEKGEGRSSAVDVNLLAHTSSTVARS